MQSVPLGHERDEENEARQMPMIPPNGPASADLVQAEFHPQPFFALFLADSLRRPARWCLPRRRDSRSVSEFVNGFHDTANAVATVNLHAHDQNQHRGSLVGDLEFDRSTHFVGGRRLRHIAPIAGGVSSECRIALESSGPEGVCFVIAASLWNLGPWYLACRLRARRRSSGRS